MAKFAAKKNLMGQRVKLSSRRSSEMYFQFLTQDLSFGQSPIDVFEDLGTLNRLDYKFINIYYGFLIKIYFSFCQNQYRSSDSSCSLSKWPFWKYMLSDFPTHSWMSLCDLCACTQRCTCSAAVYPHLQAVSRNHCWSHPWRKWKDSSWVPLFNGLCELKIIVTIVPWSKPVKTLQNWPLMAFGYPTMIWISSLWYDHEFINPHGLISIPQDGYIIQLLTMAQMLPTSMDLHDV